MVAHPAARLVAKLAGGDITRKVDAVRGKAGRGYPAPPAVTPGALSRHLQGGPPDIGDVRITMRFEQHDLTTTHDPRLDEIVSAFTPSMRRVCGFFRADELEAMIERMARNHLAARELASRLPAPIGAAAPLGTRRAARPGAYPFARTPLPES